MRSEQEIRNAIELFLRNCEQQKREALTAENAEIAVGALRNMYDWRIRIEMLNWVLQEANQ